MMPDKWISKKSVLEIMDNINENKKQTNPENDGNSNPPVADHGLFFLRSPLRFKGNVQEVIETKNCLQPSQHCQGKQIIK